ncbi:hypothetical protein [Desulfoferrobacter suflitae]|jgi:hypothetical protein|uniref:hypothetical protein n=1 Tax=Desulfoferrobacter suflitae TaxID=2865782 RepID=UPI0021641480|nr:hypothetical protein [Desulfoferrobacter suflitae]MCK8604191.1 hypothetical protein [Desulfoferrobacter suflitae]
MIDSKKRTTTDIDTAANLEDDESFVPSAEGMSTATARLVIDKGLRKKILQDYDLVAVENKGRYCAAKAFSKDGEWLYELLIDKQTGGIQVASQREVKGEKDR